MTLLLLAGAETFSRRIVTCLVVNMQGALGGSCLLQRSLPGISVARRTSRAPALRNASRTVSMLTPQQKDQFQQDGMHLRNMLTVTLTGA